MSSIDTDTPEGERYYLEKCQDMADYLYTVAAQLEMNVNSLRNFLDYQDEKKAALVASRYESLRLIPETTVSANFRCFRVNAYSSRCPSILTISLVS